MLFFTVIVLWLSIYWGAKVRGLVELNGELGILLGIAGIGTFVGKATDSRRLMLSEVNFSWIRNKKWIKKDLHKGKYEKRRPKLSDLITTDGNFDIARFQAVGFTLVIGVALLIEGIDANVEDVGAFSFSIGETYLTLIGVSQGLYVGGKFSQKDELKQLDQKLDQVREKEQIFKTAVSESSNWQEKSSSLQTDRNQLFKLACRCAPKQFSEFLSVAEEASSLVSGLSGRSIDESRIRPSLPFVF